MFTLEYRKIQHHPSHRATFPIKQFCASNDNKIDIFMFYYLNSNDNSDNSF